MSRRLGVPQSGLARHGDRELPEIAANGTAVTAVEADHERHQHGRAGGRRRRRPDPERRRHLKSWPEGCRAIMLAAAKRNIAGNTWWRDRRRRCRRSDGIRRRRRARGRAHRQQPHARATPPASRRGWDVGTLRSRDIGRDGRTTFSYNVTVPRFFWGRAREGGARLGQQDHHVLDIFGSRSDRLCSPSTSTCRSSTATATRSATAARGTTATRSPSSRHGRRDLHDQDPPLVRHRRRLVRHRLDRAGHAVYPAGLGADGGGAAGGRGVAEGGVRPFRQSWRREIRERQRRP